MRRFLAVASLVTGCLATGCTGVMHELDAAEADAGADAWASDVGTDASDASTTCAHPTRIAYAQAFLAGPDYERPLALAVSPIDETFVIGGTIGDELATMHDGFHVNWADDPPGPRLTRTYGPDGASSVHDVAIDTHGNLTIGGTFTGPTDIERSNVASTSGGFVARVIAGGAVSVATLGPSVTVNAVSRRGDGYYVAGDFASALDIDAEHCDAPGGFVAAFGRDGVLAWLRCLVGITHVRGLAVHDAGEAYVVGDYTGTLAVDGEMITSRGGSDGFVARLSGAGDGLWLRSVGTSDTDETLARVVVTGSHVVAVGTMGAGDVGVSPMEAPLGAHDGVAVVLDLLAGDDEGVARLGGPSEDALVAIAADTCGGVWLVGSGAGVAGSTVIGAIVQRMDAATRVRDPELLGAAGQGVVPSAVAVTQDGAHVVVTGFYNGSPTLAGTTLPIPLVFPTDPFVLGIR